MGRLSTTECTYLPTCATKKPVRIFQRGRPPEKAKLRRWWTYLSQLRLSVHHIQGVKKECANYISRNNVDDMIGARSEELAKEAFSRMNGHLGHNAASPTIGEAHTNAARPSLGGGTHKHSTPQLGGGHTPAQPHPRPGKHNDNQLPTMPAVRRRNNSEPTHQAGYNTTNENPNTPTQHAPPRGGRRTDTARPNTGGGTQEHNTNPAKPTKQPQQQPTEETTTTQATHHQTTHHHRGGQPPTQHAPSGGGRRTNTARPSVRGATNQRSTPHNGGGGAHTNTARPTMDGGTHKHSMPQQVGGGGHASERAPTPARQTTQPQPQPNRRRQLKPNTTTPPPITAADRHQHSTPHQEGDHKQRQPAQPWEGPQTNTARPTMRGTGHQHRTNPGQAINTTTTAAQPPTTATRTRRS